MKGFSFLVLAVIALCLSGCAGTGVSTTHIADGDTRYGVAGIVHGAGYHCGLDASATVGKDVTAPATDAPAPPPAKNYTPQLAK